jgi:hypothetical protein
MAGYSRLKIQWYSDLFQQTLCQHVAQSVGQNLTSKVNKVRQITGCNRSTTLSITTLHTLLMVQYASGCHCRPKGQF